MSKVKAVEKEYQELVERWCKLQQIYKLRESEVLGDFTKWNHYLVEELEKIKKNQAEFETQLINLRVRLFEVEGRTTNERKRT